MSQFYAELADIFEVDVSEITPDFDLHEAGWDSLAIVTTIAAIDDVFDVTVSPAALADCRTVGDVERLVKAASE
jgi:acyl carrier protein